MVHFTELIERIHRLVWVGKALKDHLVPAPCRGQGHIPLDQVAHSSIQPYLEHWVGASQPLW